MCDGGDGPGGPSGPSHGGEVGNQEGGNPGGGSGGNVGPGYGGGSGGLPTTRADPPAFNAPDIGQAVGGDSGGFYAGWEEATQVANQTSANPGGAFGFDSPTGMQYGGLIGSILGGGLPGLVVGSLLGGMLGQAQGGGNVSDYGAGDPNAGGGPIDPTASLRPFNPKPPGWGEGGGDFWGSMGSAPVPTASTNEEAPGLPTFGMRTTPDRDSVMNRYTKPSDDDDLLKTIVFGEKEFTKNLF